MRRKDREISRDEAIELLEVCEYGILSLADGGEPYAVPVNYVYFNGLIYFHCATEGKKLDFIAKNPRVQFTVVGKTKPVMSKFTSLYESAFAFGKAATVENLDEKRLALIELCKKYAPDTETDLEKLEKTKRFIDGGMSKTAIIKIELENVSGKANK